MPLSNFCWLPALLGLYRPSLCLCLHMACSSVLLCVLSSPYRDTSHWIWGLP